VAIDENDIPDVVNCWEKRTNKKFVESRKLRVDELRTLLAPLKEERRKMQAEINRLTFDHVIETPSALAGTSPKSDMETLDDCMDWRDSTRVFGEKVYTLNC
jgi:hypothetical protein